MNSKTRTIIFRASAVWLLILSTVALGMDVAGVSFAWGPFATTTVHAAFVALQTLALLLPDPRPERAPLGPKPPKPMTLTPVRRRL